jgi:histidinol-phosphate aminotransferase
VTDWARFVRPTLHGLQPYDPGPRMPELEQRLGRAPVRLNRNEDLFAPFPGMREAVEQELASVWMYPEESYDELRAAVARRIGTTADRIVPAHGSQALIGTLAGLFLDPGDAAVTSQPTYGLYAKASAARGASAHLVPLRDLRVDFEALAATAAAVRAKVVWVCDPNNPTGSLSERGEWQAFLDALPEACVAIVDEAYADYVDPARRLGRERDVEAGRPVVVLRTLSKLFGIAGLRLGYAIADPQLARYIDVMQEPFNVNRAAIAAGLVCLARAEPIEQRRLAVAEARETLRRGLSGIGLEPLPSQTNFVLVDTGVDDAALADALAEEGLLVRAGGEYGLHGFVRITVGPVPLMERVVDAIGHTLARWHGSPSSRTAC